MRVVIISTLLVAMANSAPSDKLIYDVNDAPALFQQFIKDYDRNYKEEEDKRIHFEAFKKNLVEINELNSQPGQTTTFGINKFADYTEEEHKMTIGGIKLSSKEDCVHSASSEEKCVHRVSLEEDCVQ